MDCFAVRPCRLLGGVLLAALAGSALACNPAQVEQARRRIEAGANTPEALAAIEARIAAVTSRVGEDGLEARLETIPGVAIAVVDQGRVEWVAGFGHLGSGDPRRIDVFSLFQGASLSKPITALLALQLAQEGSLALDGDVAAGLSRWSLPDNPYTAVDPVTPRRLMSHTAGFNLSSFGGYLKGTPIPTLTQVLDGLPPARNQPIQVRWRPGLVWSYAGGGVLVLQQLIEDVSGQSFGRRAQERVLYPAGMGSSHFDQPDREIDRWRTTSGSEFGSLVYPHLAAAGLWSNPLDLARLVVAVQESLAGTPGALLDAETAALMIEPQSPGPSSFDTGFADGAMGLGFFLRGRPEPRWFWHTGGNWGFESVLVGSVEGGRGAVVMANAFGGRVLGWQIIDAIAEVYGWSDW